MPSGAYKVTPEELIQGSGKISSFAGNIANELAQTRQEVSRLTETWTGTAEQNFQSAMSEFDTAAQKQQEALAKLADLLGKAGGAYSDTEAQVSSKF